MACKILSFNVKNQWRWYRGQHLRIKHLKKSKHREDNEDSLSDIALSGIKSEKILKIRKRQVTHLIPPPEYGYTYVRFKALKSPAIYIPLDILQSVVKLWEKRICLSSILSSFFF